MGVEERVMAEMNKSLGEEIDEGGDVKMENDQ
jgi:hypothetical protein